MKKVQKNMSICLIGLICSISLFSMINTAMFNKVSAENVTPYWPEYRSPIADCDRYYAFKSYEPIYCKYTTGGNPINQEHFKLMATDSTKEERRRFVVNDNEMNNGEMGEGDITLKAVAFNSYPGTCVLANDLTTFSMLNSIVKPNNSATFVGYGKFLYRYMSNEKTMEDLVQQPWNYIDLANGATVTIPSGNIIQVAFIYALEETGNWIQPNYFYHIFSFYNLVSYKRI